MSAIKAVRDDDGIILKFPKRTCLECKNYPCFIGIETMECDFAKYGCVKFNKVKRNAI